MTTKTGQKPANIFAAFVAAQRDMSRAMKDTPNPHFRSKYADLGAVQDACMPALHKHGFGVVQPLEKADDGYQVRTILIHESGEQMEPDCPIPLILGKHDMQGLGSAITYARRYGLFCLSGVAPEDDDGNKAAEQAPKNGGAKNEAKVSGAQAQELWELGKETGSLGAFLSYHGIQTMTDLPAHKFEKAREQLQAKLAKQQESNDAAA